MRSDHCIILTGFIYVFEILVDLESYAFLMLFFELDPDDIGTSRLDENVTRNLRAIINVAEKVGIPLSSYREYAPDVQEVVFSWSFVLSVPISATVEESEPLTSSPADPTLRKHYED